MARRRRLTCVVQSEGLSFTTKSTNLHEWGAASPGNFLFGLIPKAACFWTSECSAGVSPAWVSRSMAGETPALQKTSESRISERHWYYSCSFGNFVVQKCSVPEHPVRLICFPSGSGCLEKFAPRKHPAPITRRASPRVVKLTVAYVACNASSTTRGLRAVTINKALAAPSGSRRFCSQF